MIHRIPLWGLGPLCFFSAAAGADDAGVLVLAGILLSALFTLPLLRELLEDVR